MLGVPLLRCVSRLSQAQALRAASIMCSKSVPQWKPAGSVRFKRLPPVSFVQNVEPCPVGISQIAKTYEQVKAEMFEVLSNFKDSKFDRDSLKMDLKFIDDLSLDSLDLVEFIMVIEDAFEVEITDDEADTVITLQDCMDLLKEKMGIEM